MISQIIVPIAGTLLCYVLFHASQILYRNLTSPLRHVEGPRNPSFILGNFKAMADDPHLTAKWRREFGANFLFNGLFSISELHTSDLKAINHIIAKAEIYQKAPSSLAGAQILLGGKGLLSVERDEHKRHASLLHYIGGHTFLKDSSVSFIVSPQLRDIWTREVAQQDGEARIEVMSWLRRMTLDVIGQAGFNYRFDALETNGKPNELNEVFTDLFHSPQTNRYAGFRSAQAIMPILRLVIPQPVPGWKLLLAAHNKMYTIGKGILSKSKADIMATEGPKTLGTRRDLLSMLLKANLSTNIPETQRLSDAEVIAHPNLFFAGHETTSSAITWALHELSLNTAVQSKLREELLTISNDNPSMDELNALPYLEQVIRETMRVHAPAVFTTRMAMEDDLLPLSKPYIDKKGKSHDSFPIPKGQMIHIPILAVNTDKEIWGEDAAEFKPERWEKVPDSASAIPSVWANLLTFFAGPHNCIGFRFSLAELKALLFILVRAFEFEPAVPKSAIGPTTGLLQRPRVLAEHGGSGLPLIVKRYNAQL
ncbi:cytochrome P450 [Mycena capillaripes]|nr:cytochrome P450 [Mycena capillaripes]